MVYVIDNIPLWLVAIYSNLQSIALFLYMVFINKKIFLASFYNEKIKFDGEKINSGKCS